MADDLTTRCLAEVERAMEETHHEFCGRFSFSAEGQRLACDCDRESRLASRLARMVVAAANEALEVGWGGGVMQEVETRDDIVRALAAARETT